MQLSQGQADEDHLHKHLNKQQKAELDKFKKDLTKAKKQKSDDMKKVSYSTYLVLSSVAFKVCISVVASSLCANMSVLTGVEHVLQLSCS